MPAACIAADISVPGLAVMLSGTRRFHNLPHSMVQGRKSVVARGARGREIQKNDTDINDERENFERRNA